MALRYVVDAQDLDELDMLRNTLIIRRKALRVPLQQVSVALGRNEEFLSSLEKGRRDSPRLSSVQLWAKALRMRVEFSIDNFWLHAHVDKEMLALWSMSRPWDGDDWARLWLVSALAQWRVRQRVSFHHVATELGMSVDAVRRWEIESTDPVLKRVMVAARACGTRVRMSLWERDDWTFSQVGEG